MSTTKNVAKRAKNGFLVVWESGFHGDALYETAPMLQFARLSLSSGLPDRTTIMHFRHLLERNQLGRKIFDSINEWLSEAGVITTQGTLVDATIIDAQTSTKNKKE